MPRRISLACLFLVVALLPPPAHCGDNATPAVLIQRGERFLNMGRLDAAWAQYAKVLACCEGTGYAAEAHNDMGVILARRGDPERAIDQYEQAIAINGYALAWFNLGRSCRAIHETTGEDVFRARALEAFEVFAELLSHGKAEAPVVDMHRRDLERYLHQALEDLGQ